VEQNAETCEERASWDDSLQKTTLHEVKPLGTAEVEVVVTETLDKAETAGVDPVSDKSEDMSWL
jgi:hypothetical protein